MMNQPPFLVNRKNLSNEELPENSVAWPEESKRINLSECKCFACSRPESPSHQEKLKSTGKLFVAGLFFLSVFVAHQNYRYQETVQFNRQTLTDNNPAAGRQTNPYWQSRNVTLWTVWIGKSIHESPPAPPPVIQAAMQTCQRVHQEDPFINYRIITNQDLLENNLGFPLHPSFWLLDTVEKSDYLRAELLYHYGGFYMDADMLCLTSLRQALSGNWQVAAAQDRTKYGSWPSVSQNALGPFRPKSALAQEWHDLLFTTMDELTPQLNDCQERFAASGADDDNEEESAIPYPQSRPRGTSLCGVSWGGVIDFVKPVFRKHAEAGLLGHDLSMCNVEGRSLGWDGADRPCHLVHLGTAGKFYEKTDWTLPKLCQELPVLRNSPHCLSASGSPVSNF